jgi:hypothetical protein
MTRGSARALALLLAASAAALGALAAPRASTGATRLFITNHMNSNDVRWLAAWNGRLAAATTGGLVTVAMPAGPLVKTLRSADGLPSNQALCAVESPSGLLWVGTADRGIARLRTDGTIRRTLTTFDGLPSDRVQALLRSGDSLWVGTSGGVALFTESPANGQIALRRSDTNASTAGALISDDVRALAVLGDTLWCATGAGLAAFAAGAWIDRRDVFAAAANALLAVADTLWVGLAAGPRPYAGGTLGPVAPGHFGQCLALTRAGGAVYSGADGAGVFRYAAGAWTNTGAGLPIGRTQALGVAPDGALWAGTQTGLARYGAGAGAWTTYRTDGPLVDAVVRASADAGGAWFTTGNASAPGTGGGVVVRYDGTSWTSLTTASTGGALQAASTFGLLSDRDGRLWLGHCCSDADPKPRSERYNPADDSWVYPGPPNILAYGQAPSGRVYGASDLHGSGIYIFDRLTGAVLDSLTPMNTQGSAVGAGLTSNDLRAVAIDALGRGWFALAANGLDRWDGMGTDAHADDAWAHFAAGLPSLSTTSVAVLSPTLVYVGTAAGIAPLRNDLVDTPWQDAVNAVIGAAPVNALAADPRGIVWIGTGAGLVRVEEAAGSIERFTTAAGLVDDDVRALAWDEERGVLWAGTARGISRILPSAEGTPAFDDGAYVYPNPLGRTSGLLRIGGLAGEATGEIRDVTGKLIHRFRADPASNVVWDLRGPGGEAVAPGVYLVVLRDGPRTRILRAAVVR